MRVSKQPQERRAELIAAARRLFDKRGVDKTRVSDIVGEVGVAQGVFYYYFDSKEEMIDTVIEQVEGELTARADAILADRHKSFSRQVADFIELYLDWIDQWLGDEEVNLQALFTGGLTHNRAAGHAAALLEKKMLALVRLGADGGQTQCVYPEQSAQVLLYGLQVLAAKQLPGHRMLYALVEQGLCLAPGSLVRYAGEESGKGEKA